MRQMPISVLCSQGKGLTEPKGFTALQEGKYTMFRVLLVATQFLNGKSREYSFDQLYDTREEAEEVARDWESGGAIDPHAYIEEW